MSKKQLKLHWREKQNGMVILMELCLAAVHAKRIAMSQHSTQEAKRNGNFNGVLAHDSA